MAEQRSLIRRLFDMVWGVVITLYRVVFLLGIVVFFGFVWMAFKGGPTPKVENNVALVIWPTGDVVDQLDPETRFVERIAREPPSQTLLRDLTDALETAADDPRIATVVLKLDTLNSAGMAQLEELVAAMHTFQAAGKTIHAYGPYFDQTSYYAAAAADDVSIDPMGSVLLEGLGVYQQYYKDALDKVGVQMNVFRVGEFKAAVEPFIRNDMSPEARRANQEWLGDLWTGYGQQIATSRKLAPGIADTYVNGFRAGMEKLRGDGAAYAKEMGLVTHVESLAEFRQRIATDVGIDEDHGSFRQIHYAEYLHAVEKQRGRKKKGDAGSDIALVVIQGEIVDGVGTRGQAGADTIVELLEEARRDDQVAAVVLRIDSPGGSAWASELIRREIVQLREEGKPVVASMGAVAASGGYWVAMDADQIWAHETTITGSIGIFGLIPTISQPLEKLGIHVDGVGTTSLAGAFRIDRPLSEDVSAIFQAEIEKGYRDFVEGVAKGRKLEVAKVESIAQGRVWSGTDAKGFGLVDSFGGLEDAAGAAAKLAGLGEGDWKLEEFRALPMFPGNFLGYFFGSAETLLGRWSATQPILKAIERTGVNAWLQRFDDPRGVYAHCMCAPSLGSARH
ncbi:MAG: signal peptide peptidase SppA [Panacagrimonas sp.]